MMRRYTLAILLLAGGLCTAQVTPITWHFTFDPSADRVVDSLQGCWQVGPPDKTVFDSAYSAPNALVTDTVLPYPVGGISYAEFSVPVNFFGEDIQMGFTHRLDVDPGEAYGWVEYFDASSTLTWVKADPWGSWNGGWIEWMGDGIDTDSALIFTGSNNGWGNVQLGWRCISVVQGPNERASYPDSMHFRFAFQALANTNGRDGWLIDDLVVTNSGCMGSVRESVEPSLSVSPNPASTYVAMELANAPTGPMVMELFRADGVLVRREQVKGSRSTVDISALPTGPYVIRVTWECRQLVERLVIQR